MARHEGEEEEEGGDALEGADGYASKEQPDAPGPPEDVDLLYLLQEQLPLADYIAMGEATGLFISSRMMRTLISSYVQLVIRFDVLTASGCSHDELLEARRRCRRVRTLLPQEAVSSPASVFVRFSVREVPLRRVKIFQAMYKVIPMVKWEEVTKVHFMCKATLAQMLEGPLQKGVCCLSGCDPWVVLEEPYKFRNVTHMDITLTQIGNLPDDATFPRVSRLKVICRDAAFADGALDRIEKAFPNMNRMHLEMRPSALPPLCLPGFAATEDFRLSLREDPKNPSVLGRGREGSFFVASHLLSLPFTWQGGFFNRLIRFQMDELNEKRSGLSTEKMADTLACAPNLRRLGTVSLSFLKRFDITREECLLEELVISMEIEDCLRFFSLMLPLHQQGRRCSLKRLGVHVMAPDGVTQPPRDCEQVMCAGWYNVAATCLAPKGFVMFSSDSLQIMDTAFFQLPYLDSSFFSLDPIDYAECRLAVSTPLSRPLKHYLPLMECRPRGTLVSGLLRPRWGGPKGCSFEDVTMTEGTATTTAKKRSSHPSVPWRRHPLPRSEDAQKDPLRVKLLESLSIPFVDVVEYLNGIRSVMGFPVF